MRQSVSQIDVNIDRNLFCRSVTTYPLLYDNPLARRPLPREPESHSVSFSRSRQTDDVRWINGGMYGLGSNRSSFISLQTSQSNINNSPPAGRPRLLGSVKDVRERTQIFPKRTHPTMSSSNSHLMSQGNHDGLYSYGENVSLSSKCEKTSLYRSRSAMTVSNKKENSIAPALNQQLERTKSNHQRKTSEKRKKFSKRPDSTILSETLHELDEDITMTSKQGRSASSRSSSSGKRIINRRRLRRSRSSPFASERRSKKMKKGLRDTATPQLKITNAEGQNIPVQNEIDDSTNDALKCLDGVLSENLGRLSSTTTTTTSLLTDVEEDSNSRKLIRLQEFNRPRLNQTYNVKLIDENNHGITPALSKNTECKMFTDSSSGDTEINFQIQRRRPAVRRKERMRAKANPSQCKNEYDMLLLCSSGEPREISLQNDDTRDSEKVSGKETTWTYKIPNNPSVQNENNKDPFKGRKDSTDSMFVDLNSICESIHTEDGNDCCFTEEEQAVLETERMRAYGNKLFGSDQHIIDSLNSRSIDMMTKHQKPAAYMGNGLEHLTVPLSDLSDEEKDGFAVLQPHTVRSRSSSLGSITTVLNKSSENLLESIYTPAEDSLLEFQNENVDEKISLESSSGDNREKKNFEENKYQHIQSMHSGFCKEVDTKTQYIENIKPHPTDLSPSKHGSSDTSGDSSSMSVARSDKMCNRTQQTTKKRKSRQDRKQKGHKNKGYFEPVESSADEATTDIEMFDLGTL